METARFNKKQLEDLSEARYAAGHYEEFDGVECEVHYAFDIVNELRQGGEACIGIAEELIDAVYNIQFDRERYNFLAQEIGMVEIFGHFILTKR